MKLYDQKRPEIQYGPLTDTNHKSTIECMAQTMIRTTWGEAVGLTLTEAKAYAEKVIPLILKKGFGAVASIVGPGGEETVVGCLLYTDLFTNLSDDPELKQTIQAIRKIQDRLLISDRMKEYAVRKMTEAGLATGKERQVSYAGFIGVLKLFGQQQISKKLYDTAEKMNTDRGYDFAVGDSTNKYSAQSALASIRSSAQEKNHYSAPDPMSQLMPVYNINMTTFTTTDGRQPFLLTKEPNCILFAYAFNKSKEGELFSAFQESLRPSNRL